MQKELFQMITEVKRQLKCPHCGHEFEIVRHGIVACPLCLVESIIPELRAVSVPSCWEKNGGHYQENQ
jgi:Zn finger protein HypA/HybF involved in hydrogenase expression